MTFYDDPNRQAVGLAPLGSSPPAGEPSGATFDPGEHTVAEVEAYLEEHPDEREVVLELEVEGKARSSLLG